MTLRAFSGVFVTTLICKKKVTTRAVVVHEREYRVRCWYVVCSKVAVCSMTISPLIVTDVY